MKKLKVKENKAIIEEILTKQSLKETDLLKKLFPEFRYSLELFRLKYQLISYGLVKDNMYLDKYLLLISDNLTAEKIKFETQVHHSIPLSVYNEAFKDIIDINSVLLRKLSSILNPENLTVNLKFTDHILAHWYLYKCSKDKKFKKINLGTCWNSIGWAKYKKSKYFKAYQISKIINDPEKLMALQEAYREKSRARGAKIAESKAKDN